MVSQLPLSADEWFIKSARDVLDEYDYGEYIYHRSGGWATVETTQDDQGHHW